MAFPDWAHIGAKVLCINNNEAWAKVRNPFFCPSIGTVYTIRDIGYLHPNYSDIVTVLLEEIHNTEFINLVGWENSFALFRFKPLISLEEDMKMFNEILKDIKMEENV